MTENLNIMTKARRRSRAGVTLVEVMVVITILMALMALLMPAYQQTRELAQTVVCRSGLHQQGLAFAGYLTNQKQMFPDHRGDPGVHGKGQYERWWGTSIAPYLGAPITDPKAQGFFHCAGIGAPQVDYGIEWEWDFCQHHVGYGYNGWFLGIRLYNDQRWGVFETHGARRFEEVANPAMNLILADSTVKGDGRWSQSLWWPFSAEDGLHEGVSGRHRGGANILFNDGHVGWHDKLEINPASNPYWDPRSSRYWDPAQRSPY